VFALLFRYSSEILTLLLVGFCWGALLFLFLRTGVSGTLLYIGLGSVVANIQVLKTATLEVSAEPMVLGTVIFTSLFWAIDLLTEHAGPQIARRALFLSFVAPGLATLWMMIAVAYPPVQTLSNLEVQRALEILFLPAPGLFLASLSAYGISQLADIWIFSALKTQTKGRFLGLRAAVASVGSSFLDHILFSLFAWGLLRIQDVSWRTLFWTYIVGAFGLRFLLALGAVPLLYTARLLKAKGWGQEATLCS